MTLRSHIRQWGWLCPFVMLGAATGVFIRLGLSVWTALLGGIGLLLLLQWVVVPMLSVQLVRRRARLQHWQVAGNSPHTVMPRGTSLRGEK